MTEVPQSGVLARASPCLKLGTNAHQLCCRKAVDAEPMAQGHCALVDAACVAEHLGVSRGFVYAHAVELGARRLGSGPRARLRFDLEEINLQLTHCREGRGSEVPGNRMDKPIRQRREQSRSGTSVPLLPIRGRTNAV
jgi:hypothetical protein